MKYRPHRRLLSESMAECVTLEPTLEALKEHLSSESEWFDPETIEVKEYVNRPDERIGWDRTFLVMAKWKTGEISPVGMIDQMLEEK